MKRLLSMLLALVMVLSLAACGNGGGDKETEAAPKDPSFYEVKEPIEIVWWHALETQYDELVAQIVNDFNASQDKITVKAEYQGSYTEIHEKLALANKDGTGLPALTVANTPYVADYGAAGLCEDLTPYIAATGFDIDDFGAGLIEASSYEGKNIALPFLISTQVVYYNKTMADALGITIPAKVEDWDAVMAEFASKKSDMYFTEIPGWDHWYFETLYRNSGLSMISEDGLTTDLNNDVSLAMTQKIQNWCNQGWAKWCYGADASANMRQDFQDQKTFSVMHTSSLYNTYVQRCTDFEVGMAWYPSVDGKADSEIGGCVLLIPQKNTQEVKNAAWVFLQYLCSKDINMTWATETGYMPTRNSVLKTEEGTAFLAEKPAFQCIFDNLDLIKPRIQNPNYSALTKTWKEKMDQIMGANADAKTMLDEGAVVINEMLEENAE